MDDDKQKSATIRFCMVFIGSGSQLPPPSRRPQFDPTSSGKAVNGKGS
jgi:hypothetical protein